MKDWLWFSSEIIANLEFRVVWEAFDALDAVLREVDLPQIVQSFKSLQFFVLSLPIPL